MAEKPKADPVEEAHFRIDEILRELIEFRRWASPDHLAGIAHGAVMEVHNRFPKDAASLVAALHESTAALNRLIEILSTPTVREATINLPSGPATMTVSESRPRAPWLRKPQ